MSIPPIVYAVRAGDLDLVKERVGLGADMNFIDNKGATALTLAVFHEKTEIVKYLLEAGADPRHRNGEDKDSFDYCLGNKALTAILQGRELNSDELRILDWDEIASLMATTAKSVYRRLFNEHPNVEFYAYSFSVSFLGEAAGWSVGANSYDNHQAVLNQYRSLAGNRITWRSKRARGGI